MAVSPKLVPVALQSNVWIGRDRIIPLSDLSQPAAEQVVQWVETHLEEFFEGHADALSEADVTEARLDLAAWWESTPLRIALSALIDPPEPEPEPEPEAEPESRPWDEDRSPDTVSTDGIDADPFAAWTIDPGLTISNGNSNGNGHADVSAVSPFDPGTETGDAPEFASERSGLDADQVRDSALEPASDPVVAVERAGGDAFGLGPRWPATVAGFSAVVVAIAAAVISLYAQAEVAIEVEATYGRLGWLYPVVIDGGILAAAASIWAWQMSGRRYRRPWLAYGMAGGLLGVSAIVNVAHAGDDPLGRFMAALPPFVLFGAIELAATLKHRRLEALNQANTATAGPVR